MLGDSGGARAKAFGFGRPPAITMREYKVSSYVDGLWGWHVCGSDGGWHVHVSARAVPMAVPHCWVESDGRRAGSTRVTVLPSGRGVGTVVPPRGVRAETK